MGVLYRCNHCYFTASQQHHILSHILSTHEEPKNSDDQAEHKLYEQHDLQRQIMKEKAIYFTCDQCDYKATQKIYLKRHIMA